MKWICIDCNDEVRYDNAGFPFCRCMEEEE